jgi:hypothetical protein
MLTQKSKHRIGHTTSLGDLLYSNAGQVGFGFVDVPVNLTLQLTRGEIVSNLRWNMSVLLQTVPVMYG